MSFRREVHHDHLRRSRIVEGPDPHAVAQRAKAQLDAWDEVWKHIAEARDREPPSQASLLSAFGSRSDERSPTAGAPRTDIPPASREEGRAIAADLTERARQRLRSLGEILPGPRAAEPPTETAPEAFSEPPPEPPDLPDPKPEPSRTETRFHAELSFLDRLVPSRRRAREAEVERRVHAAWAAWHKEEGEAREALEAYQARFADWDRRRLEFEEEQRALRRDREEARERLAAGEAGSVAAHFATALDAADLPAGLPRETSLAFDTATGVLSVDYQLPSPGDLPSLSEVHYRESAGDYLEEHLSDSELATLYDSVVYQCVLRALEDLFAADVVRRLQAVTFNGWVETEDPATGRPRRSHTVAVEAARDRFLEIDLDRVSPRACFEGLGGLSAGPPHRVTPILPISAKAEDLEGPSEAIALSTDPRPPDFRGLGPAEFQHLIVRTLRDEFAPGPGELRVTVLNEDGSLEAVAQGPGVAHSGKVVLHVIPSGIAVEAGAVRDLLRRMSRENARRGVLLTTGCFSKGAMEEAEHKGVSLLEGRALEELVARHEAGRHVEAQDVRTVPPADDAQTFGLRPH